MVPQTKAIATNIYLTMVRKIEHTGRMLKDYLKLNLWQIDALSL